MKRENRGSRSTANTVIACFALFIALGGTSYAVATLPRNSVGTAQVRNGSLTAVDLAAGTVPASARGPRGAQGPAGPEGPRGLQGPPAALPAPEPWKPLPFAGSWSNYGNGHAAGEYRKDQLGQVHVRGLVTKVVGLPATGDVIGTLPPGYRPVDRQLFSTDTNATHAQIDVVPGGAMHWTSGSAGEPDYTSLHVIQFWTD